VIVQTIQFKVHVDNFLILLEIVADEYLFQQKLTIII